ncbi:sensor protein QseC [Proteobacteria bacterium CAG:495]|nr:sensor protein QseC [Proteobacteria bacterium CAG:495]
MKKMSLRLRLIISFLIVSTCVWTAAAIISWQESRDQMDEFFDTYQLLLARQLSTADWTNLTADMQKKSNRLIENVDDDGEEEDEALGFAVFNRRGEMIFNDDENGRDFIYTPEASGFINQKIGRKKDMWRIFWLTSADKNFTIAVGQELEFRDDAALELVEETLLPWLVGLSVLLLAVIWMVSRELRPLRRIADELSERDSDNLHPLSLSGQASEILPLIKAINAQFSRIEQMLQRERGFISDSAHELRSPLTALKVQLEVAQLADDDAAARHQALQKLNQGIDRSTRLVEQLLALSRLDSAAAAANDEPLDWPALVNAAVNEQLPAAEEKKINIKTSTDGSAPTTCGQPLLWALLLRNLLDNAVRYSPEEAQISIELKDETLSVTNSNTVVAAEYLPRLKERFFRPAGQKSTGSGLGLSIVERIAELHRCRVALTNDDGNFRVTISHC